MTATSSLRIGYLVPEFPGQTHVMFHRELEELAALGVEVDVVSTRRPAPAVQPWNDQARRRTTYLFPPTPADLIPTLTLLLGAGPRAWRRAIAAVRHSERSASGRLSLLAAGVLGTRLAVLSRRRGWAHLHVHSAASAADVARFAALVGGPTYSLTLHGPLSDYGPDQAAKWQGAAFGIVITRRLQRELHEQLDGHLPNRVAVVGMGVQAGAFTRPDPYRPWPGTGPVEIFSCGRLNPAKGHLDLIEAVRLLRENGVDARCAIAGEDEFGGRGYRLTLQQRISELGLTDAVRLLGSVSEDSVRTHLHRAHVFALASLDEPLGVAIMEAMSAGTPVVTTAAGGVPELVTDEVDGVLVPPRAPKELAGAMIRILNDPALATRLSTAGAAAAVRRAGEPSSAETLISLIRTREA